MTTTPVIAGLKASLADSYTLYLKTQNFHWNVTGPQFQSLHALFMTQYTDLALANDEIAERIRALGEFAPGSYKAFSKLASIKEAEEGTTQAVQMVKALVKDQTTLVKTLNTCLKAAQKAGDDPTTDLMIRRITQHEKNRWMLESSL